MKTIEVSLPDALHAQILSIAKESRRPASEIVRRAVSRGLSINQRQMRHQGILEYARKNAGSARDLDLELESAGLECLRSSLDDQA